MIGTIEEAQQPQTAADDLLSSLGRRVRESRARCGLTRRAVARRSGLSERFLAQVEAGTANISVLRLNSIADALGVPLHDLVSDKAQRSARPWPPAERARYVNPAALADLFRHADVQDQEAVIALLIGSNGKRRPAA
jgi:transcriptional regulator with XRE-family HTH domain